MQSGEGVGQVARSVLGLGGSSAKIALFFLLASYAEVEVDESLETLTLRLLVGCKKAKPCRTQDSGCENVLQAGPARASL